MTSKTAISAVILRGIILAVDICCNDASSVSLSASFASCQSRKRNLTPAHTCCTWPPQLFGSVPYWNFGTPSRLEWDVLFALASLFAVLTTDLP